MPFSFMMPIGSMISSMIAGKYKVPLIYMVIIASALQVIGFSLLSFAPVTHLSPVQYGYQIIAGFGTGTNISTLILITPFSVSKKDQGKPHCFIISKLFIN